MDDGVRLTVSILNMRLSQRVTTKTAAVLENFVGKEPKTTIEINGKRFDARTGKPVVTSHTASTSTPKAAAARPTVSDIKRQPHVSHTVHKQAQRSQTLMRHVVKKPVGSKVGHPKAVVDVMSPVSPQKQARPALHGQSEIARLQRAKEVSRSQLVTKFSDAVQKPIALPGDRSQSFDIGITRRVQPLAVQPHPVAPVTAPKAPAISAPLTHTQSVLARGLQNANSHLEKPVEPKTKHSRAGRKRSKLVSVGAASLAALLLGGFFAFQNVPNIAMRYAAARAGVRASLPGYRPSGFAVNNRIQYTPGAITVNFTSNTDDRQFTITQKSSNWNSETLMNNYVASTGSQVQTYEDKGRTIYLYGDSNATWVNGGVWYDITGASKLNSDQLIKIATSM